MTRSYCLHNGSALPIILLLLTVLSLLAANALQTATAETKLVESLLVSGTVFEYAELGINAGLRYAVNHPDRLPTDTSLQLEPVQPDEQSLVVTSIRATATDTFCPTLDPVPAERLHYEIHATAAIGTLIESTHIQAFYICRETCTNTCPGVESMPVKSYWTVDDNR